MMERQMTTATVERNTRTDCVAPNHANTAIVASQMLQIRAA